MQFMHPYCTIYHRFDHIPPLKLMVLVGPFLVAQNKYIPQLNGIIYAPDEMVYCCNFFAFLRCFEGENKLNASYRLQRRVVF